ncbi:hypothetical protein [Novosphingobium sp.]|uniref:hypothetical protein n=1 Tax=Novosphingobium sp. TaxID=1874826 RepID=UPI002638EFF5|nr:hypothetical protein [Novosphingobium sp.]
MIGASNNFGMLQLQLMEAARRLTEARAAQRAAPDNTENWRSARWLWPNLGPPPGQE